MINRADVTRCFERKYSYIFVGFLILLKSKPDAKKIKNLFLLPSSKKNNVLPDSKILHLPEPNQGNIAKFIPYITQNASR